MGKDMVTFTVTGLQVSRRLSETVFTWTIFTQQICASVMVICSHYAIYR